MGWGAIAAAVIGGYASSRASKKASQDAASNSGAMTDAESLLAMERIDFQANRDELAKQRERQEKMRGLDEFRKFNTVQQFAPGYTNTNPNPIVMPEVYDPIAARGKK